MRLGLAGAILLGANNSLQNASAEGDTRTLSFYHLHTHENITVTFKRDGRYDEAALKKLNWFMRDWRKDQDIRMDPQLFDILWEAYREVGGTQPIQVICGYRSPATNSMLRARSSGVAQGSLHTHGQAMDFAIPGVPLEKIREIGLRLQRGGVGFYPTSGSPFVHMDTGNIRHWPRMTTAQLLKVFPEGRTVHVPSDGPPLRGYALALADVERRGDEPNSVSLAAARRAGISTASAGKTRSLFAGLFGSGKDTEETSDEAPTAATPASKQRRGTAVASLAAPKPVPTQTIVPLPAARPQALMVAAATSAPAAEDPLVTASLAPKPNMFDDRGIWQNPDEKGVNPPLQNGSFEVAAAGSAEAPGQTVLAYASGGAPVPLPTARARPMGQSVPQLAREAAPLTAATTTVEARTPAMSFGGQRADSPWMRAVTLTPSVSSYMNATHMAVKFDPLQFTELLYKPAQSIVMTFSADPGLGMVADRFSGSAVVFLATTTFVNHTTAALR